MKRVLALLALVGALCLPFGLATFIARAAPSGAVSAVSRSSHPAADPCRHSPGDPCPVPKGPKCTKSYHPPPCNQVGPGEDKNVAVPDTSSSGSGSITVRAHGQGTQGMALAMVPAANPCPGLHNAHAAAIRGYDRASGRPVTQFKPPLAVNGGKAYAYNPSTGSCTAVPTSSRGTSLISSPGIYVFTR